MCNLKLPLEVISVSFEAYASGDGEITLELPKGEAVIEVESNTKGDLGFNSYTYLSLVNGEYIHTPISDESIRQVNKYMKEHLIFSQYMDEVYEAASQQQ